MWAWRAMFVMMPAGYNSWLIHQSSLAVLPAETSGASRRNGRSSENFSYQYLKYLKGSLICHKNLRHGTSNSTSHPKEGVLRIVIALKNPSSRPGLNPRPLGPVASTLITTAPRRLKSSLTLNIKMKVKVWNHIEHEFTVFFEAACNYFAYYTSKAKLSNNVDESSEEVFQGWTWRQYVSSQLWYTLWVPTYTSTLRYYAEVRCRENVNSKHFREKYWALLWLRRLVARVLALVSLYGIYGRQICTGGGFSLCSPVLSQSVSLHHGYPCSYISPWGWTVVPLVAAVQTSSYHIDMNNNITVKMKSSWDRGSCILEEARHFRGAYFLHQSVGGSTHLRNVLLPRDYYYYFSVPVCAITTSGVPSSKPSTLFYLVPSSSSLLWSFLFYCLSNETTRRYVPILGAVRSQNLTNITVLSHSLRLTRNKIMLMEVYRIICSRRCFNQNNYRHFY
jgi:hypothetical protein